MGPGGIAAATARALALRADRTEEAEVRHLADTVANQLGAADILAALVGGGGMPIPTSEETVAHWRHVIHTDLSSTFLTTGVLLRSGTARCGAASGASAAGGP